MSHITTKIANLKADANRWGWIRSLYNRVANHTGRYLGIHVHVVRTTAMIDKPQYPSTLPGITYRIIQTEGLVKASSDTELKLSRDFVQAAITRGDIAFGAFDGSVLVAYVWRSLGAAPHTKNLWVRVNRPYCYAYNSFTRPSYRGRHIMPAIILFSDVEMLKQGYQYRAGFVAITNSASLAAGKHMGSNPIGYAGYVKWFGRYFPFKTRAAKKIGFEFFEHELKDRKFYRVGEG